MIPDEIARSFLLERFHDFLSLERGNARATSEAYARDLERFAVYARGKGASAPMGVSPQLLRRYVYHLKDLGLAPSSIRRNISTLRTYYRFLLGDGHAVQDPTERLDTPARWRTLPEVLTIAEAEDRKSVV